MEQDDMPGDRADEARAALGDELALRAGPPPVSPPLPLSLMIFGLGILGPFVFVRAAVPSVYLTAVALLVPVAGTVAVIGSVESMRRRHGDREVRTRAVIGPAGISLLARPGETEHHAWADIAAAEANASMLVLHLRGEGGRHTRRAIRYGGLETPVELIRGRITQGLQAAGT